MSYTDISPHHSERLDNRQSTIRHAADHITAANIRKDGLDHRLLSSIHKPRSSVN